MAVRNVFLTGGTGYMGSRLIPRLLARGHRVTACVRRGSEGKVPAGARALPLDPLDAAALKPALPGHDTWVQLIGTPHPAPWKGAQFRAVELRAAQTMADALPGSTIRHAIYLSVAQPAPTMKAYLAVRQEGEALLRATGIPCTFLRPWYVLGPGHRWPYALLPFYALLERIPATQAGALRLGLVTLEQMLTALLQAIESDPPPQPRIIDVPAIRRATLP
ncbi:MAG: NAD(P)H-binding protein [Fibrobacteres bacterium]|nr:NAD(P)H-binding protein [Fibrobacterota bacterium]